MTTTDTTTTLDPATCKVTDLKIEATRLGVPNRSKMTTPELREAVAAAQAEPAAAVSDLNVTEPEHTPTADEAAAVEAQADFEATATPEDIEAQVDAAIEAHETAAEDVLPTQRGVDDGNKADEVATHPTTRGVISTKAFRDAHGKRPSTMGTRAWKFALVTEGGKGRTRTFKDTTYRAAAAALVGSEGGDTRWTLLP